MAASLAGSLAVGQELSPAEIEQLRRLDAEEEATRRAMRLISRRPRSRFELRRYFDRHEIPEAVQDAVIEKLTDREWVDDQAFANAWVENRTEYRPRGAFALKAELIQKGIPSEEIRAALEGFDEAKAAVRAAEKAAHKYKDLSKDEFHRRVGAYLQRRGFRRDLIHSAVKRTWRETEADESEEIK